MYFCKYVNLLCFFRHTAEILWVQFQTTLVSDYLNKASHINFFGFLVYMIVMYTLYNSLIVKYVIVLNLKKCTYIK